MRRETKLLKPKYYRVVSKYLGDIATFIPVSSYENIDIVDGKLAFTDKSIKEVCFSKEIQNCFFAISMFIENNTEYYIYRTNEKPFLDISSFDKGDFIACKEVRFREPVNAEYIGSFKTDDLFFNAIKELYTECNLGEFFLNQYALDMLETYYNEMYYKIKFKNEIIKKDFFREKGIL